MEFIKVVSFDPAAFGKIFVSLIAVKFYCQPNQEFHPGFSKVFILSFLVSEILFLL